MNQLPTPKLPADLRMQLSSNGEWSLEAQTLFMRFARATNVKRDKGLDPYLYFLDRTKESLTAEWIQCTPGPARTASGLLLVTGPSFQTPQIAAYLRNSKDMTLWVWLGPQKGFAGDEWKILKVKQSAATTVAISGVKRKRNAP